MQRLFGATLLAIVRTLERIQPSLFSIDPERQAQARSFVADSLGNLLAEGHKIPLRRPFIAQVERLEKRAKGGEFLGSDLALLTGELLENLTLELAEYLFFAVPPSRKWIYLEPDKWFGELAVTRFGIEREVRDACQCYALAQWTATVFHSMRILEPGLKFLADRFNISFEKDSWHKVITGIEDGIDALRNKQGLSAKDREDITAYSEAATQFRYFKDAWRNHVSHGRDSYDEDDAQRVVTHVRDFMRHLASRP